MMQLAAVDDSIDLSENGHCISHSSSLSPLSISIGSPSPPPKTKELTIYGTATLTHAIHQSNEIEDEKASSGLQEFLHKSACPPLAIFTVSGIIYTYFQLPLFVVIAGITLIASTVFVVKVFYWIEEFIFNRLFIHSPFNIG